MIKSVKYYLFDYWEDVSDPRTRHLIFLNERTPWILVWLVASYALYAKFAGPRLMHKKEAFELRIVMMVYNAFMAIINFYSFYKAVKTCEFGRRFQTLYYPNLDNFSKETITEIHFVYLYWLTKFLDLTDTLIFVLRKKYSQITLLHLYHHSIVPIFGWLVLIHNPLIPGGLLFGIINSFIHVVMYSYYALSAMGPKVHKFLWWKKYITVMQLWQFVIFGLYVLILFLFQTGYPPVWLYLGLSQPPLFFYLFFDFYAKAYRIKNKIKY